MYIYNIKEIIFFKINSDSKNKHNFKSSYDRISSGFGRLTGEILIGLNSYSWSPSFINNVDIFSFASWMMLTFCLILFYKVNNNDKIQNEIRFFEKKYLFNINKINDTK